MAKNGCELPGRGRPYMLVMEGEKDAQIRLRDIMSRRKLKKTVLCKYFAEQTCTRGDRCRFAHNLNLLDSEKFSFPTPPPTRLAQVVYRTSEKEGSGTSPGASSPYSPASVNPVSLEMEPWPSSVRNYESFGTSLLITSPCTLGPPRGGDQGGNLYSPSSQFGNKLLQPSYVRWSPQEMTFGTAEKLQKTSSMTSGYIERFAV